MLRPGHVLSLSLVVALLISGTAFDFSTDVTWLPAQLLPWQWPYIPSIPLVQLPPSTASSYISFQTKGRPFLPPLSCLSLSSLFAFSLFFSLTPHPSCLHHSNKPPPLQNMLFWYGLSRPEPRFPALHWWSILGIDFPMTDCSKPGAMHWLIVALPFLPCTAAMCHPNLISASMSSSLLLFLLGLCCTIQPSPPAGLYGTQTSPPWVAAAVGTHRLLHFLLPHC